MDYHRIVFWEHPVPPYVDLFGGRLVEGPDYHVVRTRGSDDHLLVATLSGRGSISDRRGGSTTVTAGDLALMVPGVPQDYRTVGTTAWEILFVHFVAKPEWQPLLRWPPTPGGHGVLALQPPLRDRVVTALDDCVDLVDSGLSTGRALASNRLEAALLWCSVAHPGARAGDERVLAVVEHVGRHLAEDLGVGDLAAVAGLSVQRFTAVFGREMGCSPRAYVERRRLSRAKQLLALSSASVAEVARRSGFRDPLYFSRRFRAVVGCSPSAYRAATTGAGSGAHDGSGGPGDARPSAREHAEQQGEDQGET